MDTEPQESTKLLQAIINNQWYNSESDEDDTEEEISFVQEEESELVEESSFSEQVSSDLTLKYINGEVPFSEISNYMLRLEADAPPLEFEKPSSSDNELPKKKTRRKRNALPKALTGVMGAANLCFAQGKYEESIKMCLEIIRQAPTAPEPFHLLGFVYDELGDREKALQYSLISAYLQPNDPQQWKDLAAQALELNNQREALNCYNMAIKMDPKNLELYWAKCELLEKMGEKKKLLACYESILLQIPEEGKTCFDLSRLISQLYCTSNNIASAAQVMHKAIDKFPEHATVYDVNDLLNMKISLKKHKDSLNILQKHCNISIISEKPMQSDDDFQEFMDSAISCEVPETIIVDFLAKLIICLIHLRASHIVPPLIQILENENLNDIVDLYLDVADAFMEACEFETALTLLSKIINFGSSDKAIAWVKYADCLCALGREDEAMTAYQKVIELSPKHLGARLSLSTLQRKRNMTDAAIDTLKQDYTEVDAIPLNTELLFQRCKLLYSKDMMEEFIKEAKILLCSHSFQLLIPAQFSAVVASHTFRKKIESLREIQVASAAELSKFPPTPKFTSHSIPDSEMWDITLKLVHKLYELKRFEELKIVTFQLLTSSLISKCPDYYEDAQFMALLACFFNNDINHAYIFAKEMCLKDLHNPKTWTFFALITLLSENIRHHRFCLRLLSRNTEGLPPVLLMLAHNSLSLGSLRFAIGAYTELLEDYPNDPFLYFHIGIACIHMACQKFQVRKNYLMFQGLVYVFKYVHLRGICKESLYNLGRSFHQLGMNHFALHFYKQALDKEDIIINSKENDDDLFNLNREIAFNMHHIYKLNNCDLMSHYYLQKYCIL